MVTRDQIDKFYTDVRALDLKFPGAVIAKATGANKGNVSQILRKKLEPSESFLKAFYDKFGESFKNVSHGINGVKTEGQEKNAIYSLSESNRIIAESNKALAESNRLLAKSNLELVEQVKSSGSVSQEKTLTVETILPGLQELLIDLGLGKLWKSKDEGSATLHRHLFGSLKEKKSKDIHESSGKLHK